VSYTDSHLPDIDIASLELHDVLANFRPIKDDYASLPYEDAFNWSDLHLPLGLERDWCVLCFRGPGPGRDPFTRYAVSFRSRRKPSDSTSLYEADKASHEEAVSSGGLLLYWSVARHWPLVAKFLLKGTARRTRTDTTSQRACGSPARTLCSLTASPSTSRPCASPRRPTTATPSRATSCA
jgi:hypothetical protein